MIAASYRLTGQMLLRNSCSCTYFRYSNSTNITTASLFAQLSPLTAPSSPLITAIMLYSTNLEGVHFTSRATPRPTVDPS